MVVRSVLNAVARDHRLRPWYRQPHVEHEAARHVLPLRVHELVVDRSSPMTKTTARSWLQPQCGPRLRPDPDRMPTLRSRLGGVVPVECVHVREA